MFPALETEIKPEVGTLPFPITSQKPNPRPFLKGSLWWHASPAGGLFCSWLFGRKVGYMTLLCSPGWPQLTITHTSLELAPPTSAFLVLGLLVCSTPAGTPDPLESMIPKMK